MKHILGALVLSLLVTPALAQEDFEEISYESLLKELSSQSVTSKTRNYDRDFFGSVLIHAGFGLINSQVAIESDNERFFRRKNGFQLAVGIDLASPEWILEGAVRNYGRTENENEFYSLREFDLKIAHSRRLKKDLGLRTGGGLAARYLKYNGHIRGDKSIQVNESTPSAIGFVGFEYFPQEHLSFGIDINVRSALIADTADKLALDMTFKVDTHF